MRYEVAEKIITQVPRERISHAIEEQFKKVSKTLYRQDGKLIAKSLEASFGSINRDDTTTVEVRAIDGGYLLVADVEYQPALAFWLIAILDWLLFNFFGTLLFFLQIAFYLTQKTTVKKCIEDSFQRVKTEYSGPVSVTLSEPSQVSSLSTDLDQLQKLGALRDSKVLTEEEFQAKKLQILGA